MALVAFVVVAVGFVVVCSTLEVFVCEVGVLGSDIETFGEVGVEEAADDFFDFVLFPFSKNN